MNEMSESLDKKSFFMMAAYIAENATDEVIIKHLKDTLKKYDDAKASGATQKQLDYIFMEVSIISYVNVVRMIDKKASDMIKDMENVERVFDLIKPSDN